MAIKAQMQGTNVSFRTEAPGAAEPERTPQSQGSTAAKTLPAQQEPDPQQPTASVTPTPAFSISSPATFTQKASATAVPTTTPGQEIANTALNKVIESADKMRSDGKTSVELQVKLDDGQQLSVRLQMTQGTIRPVFKTESPELRQAIEQNWAGFKSSASERGLEIATPVFESPGSGSGFNPYGNRDQSRQSAGDPSDTEAMESSPAPGIGTGAKPVLSQPQTASQTGSAVQMYA